MPRWFILFFLLLAVIAPGCETTPAPDAGLAGGGRPAWVSGLREDVEPVPRHDGGSIPPTMTPTEWSATEQPATVRGVPADLTRRIGRRSSPPAAARSAAPATPATPSSAPLVVNIGADLVPTSGEMSVDDAPAPATPSSSTLERLYRGRFERAPDRGLEQFGYGYFADANPPEDPGPVPADYVIGPDDEILVTVWGSLEATHRLTVDRDGQIAIPEIGTVVVAGRTFGELGDVIRRAYGTTRKAFELDVSLGRLRSIRVHVVGDVVHPGAVDVPARSTVLSALLAVGGPTKGGSLRRVELRRGDTVRTIDLYGFLTRGESAGFEAVQANDVLFVPTIGATVGVAGVVQRPAIYEVTGPASIEAVIELAGGLTPFTFTPHVQIERTRGGRGRETVDVTLDDVGLATMVGDGELLLVGAVDDQMQPVVRISGEVVRAGTYQFRPGMRLRELLAQADGFTVDAYLPQAFVSRQIGETGCVELLAHQSCVGSTRRVLVVDLHRAIAGDESHDIELRPLDHVEIRSREESTVRPTVQVIGPAKEPGTYELTAGLRVSDLVALSGNLRPEAYQNEAELIRRVYDDETRRMELKRFRFDLGQALQVGGEHDPLLQNEDRLVIRRLGSGEVTVSIDGQVPFPGTYVFPLGAQVTDLLSAAGGVLESGDLRAAVFTRESVRRLQQTRLEHLRETTRRQYEGALETMVQTGDPNEGLAAKLALNQTKDLLDRMSGTQASGRVVIPFLRTDFPATEFNLSLENGDRLVIPRRQETVAVIGHVFNPSTFVAENGLTVETVLARAGGMTEFGDEERLYVMRADGNVESLAQRGRRLSLRTALLPGDVVLVPREPLERTFGAQFSDVLMMARQAAEVSLLFSAIGQDRGDFTTILQPPVGYGLRNYNEVILDR
ncbi:MAG: SLBB domain-containing protein [Planctomycetota bacterium]|jgi:protein involved in polysaccharide export with SLBB domain